MDRYGLYSETRPGEQSDYETQPDVSYTHTGSEIVGKGGSSNENPSFAQNDNTRVNLNRQTVNPSQKPKYEGRNDNIKAQSLFISKFDEQMASTGQAGMLAGAEIITWELTATKASKIFEPVGQPLMEINEWNPLANLANGFWGIFTGKDINGRKMDGAAPTMSIIAAIPIMKITKVVGPANKIAASIANSKIIGKIGEDAVGIIGKKVGVKMGTKMRFPDRIATGLIEEVKNVKYQHLSTQLKDYLTFAKNNKLDFIIYTRPNNGTKFSKQLCLKVWCQMQVEK